MNEHTLSVTAALLGEADPAPVWMTQAEGGSDFLLLCDHAGRSIPQRLTDLGLDDAELNRHIACDIGVEGLGRKLAVLLDACCIGQRYSRLVIDCNRYPQDAESVIECSDGTVIPGNQALSAADRAERERSIFEPYHAAISAEIEQRQQRGQPTCLILLHSFTPVWKGQPRPWQVGVLYHHDTRLAHALLDQLQAAATDDAQLIFGDNEPYTAADGTDYALARYGEKLGLMHVELEIRQDLITDEAGQQHWAGQLARWLVDARTAASL